MKKLLAPVLLTACGFAQDKGIEITNVHPTFRTHEHCLSAKGIYRIHKEDGYSYNTFGGGYEYFLKRPQGINLKFSGLTNAKGSSLLVESESSVIFRSPLDNVHTLYPLLTTRVSTHKVDAIDLKDVYINKTTFFAGMGYEATLHPLLVAHIEVLGFQDINNSLVFSEKGNFWGKGFYNPYGVKGKIGIASNWQNKVIVDLEASYAQTIKRCYRQFGLELAFKWSF